MKSEPHRRKGIRIMGGLIGLVKPLLPVMFLAVLLEPWGISAPFFSLFWRDTACCSCSSRRGSRERFSRPWGFWQCCVAFSTMENSTATISLPLSCWL